MKTSELIGAALDRAVAHCDGMEYLAGYSPSTNWAQGGPLIEREGIDVGPSFTGSYAEGAFAKPTGWCAYIHKHGGPINPPKYYGPTPLIAAMRAYVAAEAEKHKRVLHPLLEKGGSAVSLPEGAIVFAKEAI